MDEDKPAPTKAAPRKVSLDKKGKANNALKAKKPASSSEEEDSEPQVPVKKGSKVLAKQTPTTQGKKSVAKPAVSSEEESSEEVPKKQPAKKIAKKPVESSS